MFDHGNNGERRRSFDFWKQPSALNQPLSFFWRGAVIKCIVKAVAMSSAINILLSVLNV